MGHKETVQEIYQAFGRGDVAAILDRLEESVKWEYGAQPGEVPWLQPRHGKTGAAEFFASLAELRPASSSPVRPTRTGCQALGQSSPRVFAAPERITSEEVSLLRALIKPGPTGRQSPAQG